MSGKDDFDELAEHFMGLAKEYIKLWENYNKLKEKHEHFIECAKWGNSDSLQDYVDAIEDLGVRIE